MSGARIVTLAREDDARGFRHAAEALLSQRTPPHEIIWRTGADGGGDLFAAAPGDVATGRDLRAQDDVAAPCPAPGARDPFAQFPVAMLLHADVQRFALAYALLWRARDEPRLFDIVTDAQVARARRMAQTVRRDIHKMHAFVRFRQTPAPDGVESFVAWFEPDHHIVGAAAPFFARRFATMRWSILTPRASAHWDGARLVIGAGASCADAPDSDRLDAMWRVYYASIFNPARLHIDAMKREMPKKYWRNLPEASLIAPLIRTAQARAQSMIDTAPAPPARRIAGAARTGRGAGGDAVEMEALLAKRSATPEQLVPSASLEALADAIRPCRRCPLYEHATQAVCGEGPASADIMFVGEQPGDQEDLAGRPFVGPAGQVFDEALKRVGLVRERAYVTNAVKHFKFAPRGKRRIHQKPNAGEIRACNVWLEQEVALTRPRLIVAMGATAVTGLAQISGPLRDLRGRINESRFGPPLLVTTHPSYLLRLIDRGEKARAWTAFVEDLTMARDFLHGGGAGRAAHG